MLFPYCIVQVFFINILNITNPIRNNNSQSIAFINTLNENFINNHKFKLEGFQNLQELNQTKLNPHENFKTYMQKPIAINIELIGTSPYMSTIHVAYMYNILEWLLVSTLIIKKQPWSV